MELIKNKKIPYYWNSEFNLLDNLKDKTALDISRHLENILEKIKKNIVDDPFEVAKYLGKLCIV